MRTYTIDHPHYLPIPYPRFFTKELISQEGLIRPQGSSGSEFLQQMPSMTKLMLDGQYLEHIKDCHKKLKHVNPVTRYNLLRENDCMEEEDWRDKVENLKQLMEEFQSLACNEEPSNSSDGEDDY